MCATREPRITAGRRHIVYSHAREPCDTREKYFYRSSLYAFFSPPRILFPIYFLFVSFGVQKSNEIEYRRVYIGRINYLGIARRDIYLAPDIGPDEYISARTE